MRLVRPSRRLDRIEVHKLELKKREKKLFFFFFAFKRIKYFAYIELERDCRDDFSKIWHQSDCYMSSSNRSKQKLID